MSNHSNEALGRTVRSLRQRMGQTQDELGRAAGYGKGASVSISRLESGAIRPGPQRLSGIAKALGLTPEELQELAVKKSAHGDNRDGSHGGTSSGGSKNLRDRYRRIEHEIGERTASITKLDEEFKKHLDRAADEFLVRFVKVAEQVANAPQPDTAQSPRGTATDPGALATYQLNANAYSVRKQIVGGAGVAAAGEIAAGSTAAYQALLAIASSEAAWAGAVTSGLSGAAARNDSRPVLSGGTLAAGGAGFAGGTRLLATMVATPMVVLIAGGLVWMARRNRKQQQELAEQLDEAAAQLASTKAGYLALKEILQRASETLDYIATHAGHALNRWESQLEKGSMKWETLGEAEQQRYQSFIEVAGAQLTLVAINVQGILTTSGSDQEDLIQLAYDALTQSDVVVRTHV